MINEINHSIVFKGKSSIKEWVIEISSKLDKDKEYILEIKENKNKRSNPQNRYLWGVVYPIIGNKLGYDTETIHEVFKQKFGEKVTLRNNITIPKSTTKYSTSEFEQYINNICIFASEYLKLQIPEPNEKVEL